MNLLFLCLLSFGLKNDTDSSFIVMYKTDIYKMAEGAKTPKMSVPKEYQGALGKDSVDINDWMKWPYTIITEMRINHQGFYQIKDRSESRNMPLDSDKIKYYKSGKYFTSEDSTLFSSLNIVFKKEDGAKKILGFNCVKFNAVNKDNGQSYEVWATKELPQTITGRFLWPQFGYAVLEIKESKGVWKSTATSIMVDISKKDIFTMNPFDGIKFN